MQAQHPTPPDEPAQAMAEYRRRLARADWQYQFSDDHSVYQRARADFEELHAMQRTLDPEGAIWREYSRDAHGAPTPDVCEGGAQ